MERWLEIAAMEESPSNADHTGILNAFSTAVWRQMIAVVVYGPWELLTHWGTGASLPAGCYVLLGTGSELRMAGERCDDHSYSSGAAGPGIIWVVVVLLREELQMPNGEGELYLETPKCGVYSVCVFCGVFTSFSAEYIDLSRLKSKSIEES